MFALLSVWIGLGALATTIVTMVVGWGGKESVVTLLPFTYALSCTLAGGVLWSDRRRGANEAGVAGRRAQCVAAVLINGVSLLILLVAANGIFYGLAGLGIEIGFLWVCAWGYRRVVLRE